MLVKKTVPFRWNFKTEFPSNGVKFSWFTENCNMTAVIIYIKVLFEIRWFI